VFTGIRQFELADDQTGDRVPLAVMYPTTTPPAQDKPGSSSDQLSPNAPIAPGKFLLVAISPGNGGSHAICRTVAAHLASIGCVVALPDHPRKGRNDGRLEGILDCLQSGPRSISLAIDAVVSDSKLGPQVWRDRVTAIGDSTGAYTALAAASDARVQAIVVLSPATPWFFGESVLAGVNVPVLMLTGEHEPRTAPWHVEVLARALPSPSLLSFKNLPNADRSSVQREMGEQIYSFLRDELIRVRPVGLQRP
jgi:predicted dienelactone hydrolase